MTDFDTKVKFLRDLGVKKENYPKSFFDTIKDAKSVFTNTELGYCAVFERCDGKPGMFCVRDVVGTDHDRYAGHTWIDAFMDLDRGANIINQFEENPKYWEEIKNGENSDLGLIKYDGKYYIFSKAGGGNNRLISMKIRYLALIEQANGNAEEIERINNQFTFAANIRELPDDHEIPFVIVAMCEDLSGISVKKSGDMYIVLKKFTDTELYRGDSIGLKQYFRDLFSVEIHGEEEVRRRLDKIELGCHFSSPKHREVLEGILPQLKMNDGKKSAFGK